MASQLLTTATVGVASAVDWEKECRAAEAVVNKLDSDLWLAKRHLEYARTQLRAVLKHRFASNAEASSAAVAPAEPRVPTTPPSDEDLGLDALVALRPIRPAAGGVAVAPQSSTARAPAPAAAACTEPAAPVASVVKAEPTEASDEFRHRFVYLDMWTNRAAQRLRR